MIINNKSNSTTPNSSTPMTTSNNNNNNNNSSNNNSNISNNKKNNGNVLKRLKTRLLNSNNRSLATVFGVFAGLILGIILFVRNYESFPLVGHSLPTGYRIVGIFLSAGTGGNLSSYIGGTIDIITGDKTVVDLARKLMHIYKKNKDKNRTNSNSSSSHQSNNNNDIISLNELNNNISNIHDDNLIIPI